MPSMPGHFLADRRRIQEFNDQAQEDRVYYDASNPGSSFDLTPTTSDEDDDLDYTAGSCAESSSSSSSASSPVYVLHKVGSLKKRKKGSPPAARFQCAKVRGKKRRASKLRRGSRASQRVDVRAATTEAALDRAVDAPSPIPIGGIYALQTLSGDAPAFYVGKSGNIAKRLQDHRDGLGNPYLAGCDFVQVPLSTAGSKDDLESWERNETLHRMVVFGVGNVRGWMFTDRHLKPEDNRAAFSQICEKYDLCRRCGRKSHFKADCFAKSTAPWAEGLCLLAGSK